MRQRRGRARATALIVAATLAGSTVVASVTTAGAGPTAPRFADGAYTGTLVYTGEIGIADVSAFGNASGLFNLSVSGGTVGEGQFGIVGQATSVVPGGGANLVAEVSGIIDGPSVAPVLRGQSGSFSGEATVDGFTVPFSFSVGAADMVPATLNIETASCTQVVGDFVQEFSALLSAQGISNNLYGRFVAVRGGEASQDELVTLAELIANTSEVATAAAQGNLDAARLLELVEQAENFSTSLAKNTDCGFITDAGLFNTAITGIIGDLLGVALGNPDAFDSATLFLLLSIGVRVGAIGTGAIDVQKSNEIIEGFKAVFAARLDAAIQQGDQAEIQAIYVAALSMGWKALANKAEKAL